MRKVLQTLAIVVCATTPSLYSAGSGEDVVVVYNSRMPESKDVAEHYAQLRHVPAQQVLGLPLSTNAEVSRVDFQSSLQLPLARLLEDKKLWHFSSKKLDRSTVRYLLLCYGVPVKIVEDPTLKEKGAEQLRVELRRNEAAVDNELACLPLQKQNPLLAGFLTNSAYAETNAAALNPTNGILMVARLDGPSAAVARGLLDKALEAEANGLWGRAYFDVRNISDPGYKLGDEWIRASAEICRRLGFENVMDERPGTFPAGFPMSQIAIYLGWYDENVSGPFAQPKVEFMPGAFAYHLHSFSAAGLRTTNHNWVGPLLAKGATISMGCTGEPYLSGTPDLAVFCSRLLFEGFSFGEAAYASQRFLSWQTTVVGDPLYRPCARNPDLIAADLDRRHSQLLEWWYLRIADLNLANGRPVDQVVALLEELEFRKHSAVLTEKLADLYLAQGKPSSAAYMDLQALNLDPSPQQRLRLRLNVGEQLAKLDRSNEAYEQYQTLLSENPDYPDKVSLYRRLLPLAQKLQKTAEADKLQADIQLLAPSPKS